MQPSMVMINGLGRGTHSMFSSAVALGRGYGLASPVLGQSTPYQWYQKAKAETARFDRLLTDAAKIANKTAREEVLAWVGKANQEGTPANAYARTASDLMENVEAFTPPNYDAYQLERRRNRILELEDVNDAFSAKVKDATATYGALPDPVTIERIVVTPGAAAEGNPWAIPVAVGVGAIGVALIVSLFGKG